MDLSAEDFCIAMCQAASNWREETKDNKIVENNLDNLMRHRPKGYDGHIIGFPCIA